MISSLDIWSAPIYIGTKSFNNPSLAEWIIFPVVRTSPMWNSVVKTLFDRPSLNLVNKIPMAVLTVLLQLFLLEVTFLHSLPNSALLNPGKRFLIIYKHAYSIAFTSVQLLLLHNFSWKINLFLKNGSRFGKWLPFLKGHHFFPEHDY